MCTLLCFFANLQYQALKREIMISSRFIEFTGLTLKVVPSLTDA